MFCWPCVTVHQYSEASVMHFLFSLLRIKGLYMFQALLAHPQEALHKRHLVYCVCVMSVGCARVHGPSYNIPSAVYVALPEDEQVMFETCRGPYFLINWIKSASRMFHSTGKWGTCVSLLLRVNLQILLATCRPGTVPYSSSLAPSLRTCDMNVYTWKKYCTAMSLEMQLASQQAPSAFQRLSWTGW
jgi:hypothetical protein